MDFQYASVIFSLSIAYSMVACLVLFPGGIETIGEIDGDRVFMFAELIAICISMIVYAVALSVGPILWRKIEVHARNAMLIAAAAMAIAVHMVILRKIGGDYWLRLYANATFTVLATLACGFIFFVTSRDSVGSVGYFQ
ncbi:unnamed protein product [Lactuca virosa]|uniref:Uncharacterized protein n=1 Tax=Lactuca virosa TaxID=75947 RepID=A0AAU9P3A4_9ASTR|nr:unnamed protein product [Lactuca virosa]